MATDVNLSKLENLENVPKQPDVSATVRSGLVQNRTMELKMELAEDDPKPNPIQGLPNELKSYDTFWHSDAQTKST